jgi:membrane-bound serine protease (ClpP class)
MSKMIVIFAFVFILFSAIFLQVAHAANPPQASDPIKVTSVQISGLFDVHNEALMIDTLERSQESGVSLYFVKLDTNGIAGGNLQHVKDQLRDAKIATAIWVGPASVVYSKELQELVDAFDFVGAADKKLAKNSDAKYTASSFREFIAQLDSQKVSRLGDNIVLDTGCSPSEIKDAKAQAFDESKYEPCMDVKLEKNEKFKLNIAPTFEKLSPISNLAHALINPTFAVGLLVLGLCLLAFEFYAASVGVAGIAGILSVIMSIYGLGYLPTSWWAVALIALGIFAMVIDVQAGGVGFYTILGSVFTVVGIYFATSRVDAYATSYSGNVIILIMALLFMLGAIPSLIRTRFGTPTIGREDFIGEEAIADGDVDPEGNVKLRGASWKARTNHATPIKNGEKCKVVKIEGIILEVEPLVGAARDHREGRGSKN